MNILISKILHITLILILLCIFEQKLNCSQQLPAPDKRLIGNKRLPCFIIRDDFRDLDALKPSDDAVNVRLTTPSVATMLNTDNIAFTRYTYFHFFFLILKPCKFS